MLSIPCSAAYDRIETHICDWLRLSPKMAECQYVFTSSLGHRDIGPMVITIHGWFCYWFTLTAVNLFAIVYRIGQLMFTILAYACLLPSHAVTTRYIEKEIQTSGDLWFAEFVPLWDHIELNSVHGSRQQCASYQKYSENHVRKRCRKIYHLNTRSLTVQE